MRCGRRLRFRGTVVPDSRLELFRLAHGESNDIFREEAWLCFGALRSAQEAIMSMDAKSLDGDHFHERRVMSMCINAVHMRARFGSHNIRL